MTVYIVNPYDRDWARHRFVLCAGAYGSDYFVIWANHLEDALDAMIDCMVEHAPGHLCDDVVEEEYLAARAEGLSEDEAMERAEVDTTCGGNAGNRIASWEWGIAAENPDRETLKRIIGDRTVVVA